MAQRFLRLAGKGSQSGDVQGDCISWMATSERIATARPISLVSALISAPNIVFPMISSVRPVISLPISVSTPPDASILSSQRSRRRRVRSTMQAA